MVFVYGGARSGKSAFAERLALARLGAHERAVYVATALPLDEEMHARIAHHQATRNLAQPRWHTIEQPLHLSACMQKLLESANPAVVVVECMTVWLTNVLFDCQKSLFPLDDELSVLESPSGYAALSAACTQRIAHCLHTLRTGHAPHTLIVVSNEVGHGIVPLTPLGRLFRDLCGRMNQQLAAMSDHVYAVHAGIPVPLHPHRNETEAEAEAVSSRAPDEVVATEPRNDGFTTPQPPLPPFKQRLYAPVEACAIALQWLTRFPIPIRPRWDEKVANRSIVFYPVAGAWIGATLVFLACALSFVSPPATSAALVLGAWVWLTGGLHMDGWIDVADAVGSHRTMAEKQRILKDPHVGAMGVTAACVLLLIKGALVYSIISTMPFPFVTFVLFLCPLIARTILPHVLCHFPYVGGRSGMNALFKNIPPKYGRWAMCHGVLWMLCAVGTLAVFLDKGTQEMAVFPSWYPIVLALVGFVVAWLLATGASRAVCRAWGGLTGDVYGAMVEGMEVATLLAFVVMGHLMWS